MASELSPHAQIAHDLLHDRSVAGAPVLSPDGSHVAFVVATTDVDENTTTTRIWLDGAPLTAGPADGNPVWSPDGRHLAFTSRRGEKEKKSTLHVLPIEGPGETRTVCAMPDGLGSVCWSPDGRSLAFLSRTRDARYEAKDESWQAPRKVERFFSRLNGEDWVFDRPLHLHVVPADGTGAPRNLTPGEFQHSDPAWLADSSGLVVSAARHDTWDLDLATDLYRVPLEGEIEALTEQTGNYGMPAVSPDGSQIAFVGVDDPLTYPQNAKVGVMNLDGSDRRWISLGLDRTFEALSCHRPPQWLDDRTLVAAAEDRGATQLYRLDVDGSEPVVLTEGMHCVTGFSIVDDVVATSLSTVERVSEVFVERDGERTQLTDLSADHLGWERFEAPCTDGSDVVDAWIMRPVDFDPSKRYPVLLNVHGGPFTQYGEQFFDEAQMEARAGFVVLMSNPRGGSGRHTGWGQSILGPKHPVAPGTGWGTVDVDDVLAVLDTALERYDFCDADRVGMLGGSYGGYMATLLAARHGERFEAVCSERAVNNMLSEEWSSDIGTAFRSEHGPSHVEDPEEYLRLSPSTMAGDIHVPLLIIHSENDLRCPINQAEELWMTLKILGRDVTFYRFPGETHELSRSGSPLHRRQRAEIILDFFADKLTA